LTLRGGAYWKDGKTRRAPEEGENSSWVLEIKYIVCAQRKKKAAWFFRCPTRPSNLLKKKESITSLESKTDGQEGIRAAGKKGDIFCTPSRRNIVQRGKTKERQSTTEGGKGGLEEGYISLGQMAFGGPFSLMRTGE